MDAVPADDRSVGTAKAAASLEPPFVAVDGSPHTTKDERARFATWRASGRTAAMRIGEEVTYNGRRYAVVGFTPISVMPFSIELLEPETGKSFWIEWPPTQGVERAALRIVADNEREHAD